MGKKLILKPFINKRTKQMSVTIPKKRFSKRDTTLKEGQELFVELSILKRPIKKGRKTHG